MLDIFHKYIIKFIAQIHQSNGYNPYTIRTSNYSKLFMFEYNYLIFLVTL